MYGRLRVLFPFVAFCHPPISWLNLNRHIAGVRANAQMASEFSGNLGSYTRNPLH